MEVVRASSACRQGYTKQDFEAGVTEVVEDHSDLDQALREAIFQDNTAQLNMRLPPAMKTVLSKLARQRTTDATTLARIWLADRSEKQTQIKKAPQLAFRLTLRCPSPLC